MKNQKKSYFSVVFALLLMVTGSIFLGLSKPAKITNANDSFTPTYLSVFKYNKPELPEGSYSQTGTAIARTDAVFLNSNQVLIFKLADPVDQTNNAITFSSMQMFVNNQSMEVEGYVKEYTGTNQDGQPAPFNNIEIVLDLHKQTSPDLEGKYSFLISYMEYTKVNGNFTNSIIRTLTYDFYLYKTSTYYTSNLPAVTLSNVKTTLAGSSVSYSRTHEYSYNNVNFAQDKLYLPTITFNTNKFELIVTKTVSGVNTVSHIKLDSNGNLVQTNNIVMLHKNNESATVTFNDIGSYFVQYLFLHKEGNTVEYFTKVNNATKPDRMNLFGFQIYHSDINSSISNARKEFKLFDTTAADNTLHTDYQTDISYTEIQSSYAVQNSTLLTLNGSKYVINFDRINFNAENLTVPSTNQAPVDFNFNASIDKSNSFYLKLSGRENTNNLWEMTSDYTGTPFTEVGTYLVKITYSSSLSLNAAAKYHQWFFFRITNETPVFTVTDINDISLNTNSFTKNGAKVQFNQSTNPFDSLSELYVYSKNYNQTTYSNGVKIGYDTLSQFTENKNYQVVLRFGKGLTKSKVSYFTVDNTEITGLVARNVSYNNGMYSKTTAVDFFTNQNVAVEWNNKPASGNTITAMYKYIPITVSNTSYNQLQLDELYANKFIPVNYMLDYTYDEGAGKYTDLKTIPYSNTIFQSNSVSTESVFTEQGMYIFYLVDKAGNEKYYYFVIDKTNPVVLQKMTQTGIYITDFSNLNLVAEDTTVQWGKYKIIKTNLKLTGMDLTNWTMLNQAETNKIDPWLLEVLRNKARLSQLINDEDADFKLTTINSLQTVFLAPRIKTQSVMVQIGERLTLASATSYGGGNLIDQFSYNISVAKTVNGITTIYENTYVFFVSDESKTDSGSSTIHTIQVSTDISKTALRFETSQNNTITYDSLTKHNYETSNDLQSVKDSYFMPINYDVIQLQYLIAPTENTIEVESLTVAYYPYISNYLIYTGPTNSMLQNNMYYTLNEDISTVDGTVKLQTLIESGTFAVGGNNWHHFKVGKSLVLSKQPQIRVVYDAVNNINLGTLDSFGYYIWNINSFYNSTLQKNQTLSGKYTITRVYKNLDNVLDIVGSRYDYMTRNITFILDREDVVSSPVTLYTNPNPNATPTSSDYVLISQVGGSSYVEVLTGNANSTQFTEIYRAKNLSSSSQINILETNKLPVKVGIPIIKFGEVINQTYGAFSNNLFYTNSINSYIKTFEMIVTIKFMSSGQITTVTVSPYISATPPASGSSAGYIRFDNGYYLIFDQSVNGFINLGTFNSVGKYEVSISQNNANVKGNKSSLTFYFEIVNIAPTFEVEDISGNILNYDLNTQYYFTNKNTLRVTWTDSTNQFMAKIDKTNLKYFDGSVQRTATNVITQNSIYNYFDIDLTNYPDGTVITISLSYEGNSSNYPSGSFTTIKTVKIDRIAPTESLNKLIAKANESSIINSANLRQGHNQTVGYNKTTTDVNSIFRNYAFALDINDFINLIYSSTDSIELRFKSIPDKYTNSSYVELDPSSPTAIAQIRYSGDYVAISSADNLGFDLINSYYEIAEIDLAGNITVYSIYLTDVSSFVTDEENLKATNYYYKENLSDNLKVVNYSNESSKQFVSVLDLASSANNIKVYSKGLFQLEDVNVYNYPWPVVSYNNVKYIFSPRLTNTVYKWTASGATEVNLSTEINLSQSRYNYNITIRNVPKSNITLSVIVSDSVLNITAPTGLNEVLTLSRRSANDTEFVVWKNITVWEYRNSVAVRFATFENGITNPIIYSPEIEGFQLASYTTVNNVSTFVVNAISGSYYRYKVVDNFGHVYILNHLYGQEYIQPIVNNDGLSQMQTDIIDNTLYYFSDTGFSFTFYPSIVSVEISAYVFNSQTGLGEQLIFSQTITSSTISLNDVTFGTILKYPNNTNPSYITLRLNPTTNYNLSYEGDKVIYYVKTITNILDTEEANSTDEVNYNFIVYNLAPKLELKGKNRQSLNDLFTNNTNLTSEPVTIEFASTSAFDYPVEVFLSYNGGSPYLIESGKTVTAPGTYTLTRYYGGIMSAFAIDTKTFNISDSSWQFYSVVAYSVSEGKYVEVTPTGTPYVTESDGTSIYQHYIINTLDYIINLNSSQYVEILQNTESNSKLYYTDIKTAINTFIRTLSNYNTTGNQTINYFETKIAITYIPPSNKILNRFYYLNSQATNTDLTYSERNYTLEKDVDVADNVIVYWNNFYRVLENKVTVEIRYGQDNQLLSNAQITTSGTINSVTLNRSGNYLFTFRDLAGNIHRFDYSDTIQNSSTTYEFIFLKDVIFTINNQAPIPFAIYNTDVQITIPSYTTSYYDSTGKPQIIVERNGVAYTGFTSSGVERKYTFTEQGLYKVIFSAKRGQKSIKETPFYFQIIKANELTWAFDIAEYDNYYIEQITKDGVDVTRQLSNSAMGTLVNITKNGTTLPYLKNLFVSLYDEQTGSGVWQIKMNTNNDLAQTFTYSFKINTAVPPISISLEEGAKTTSTILVTFNARNLYDEVGDVTVRIGSRRIVLNQEYFNNPNYAEVYNVEITNIGETFIQILTPSERLLFSYKVTREQPLNSVALIVIIGASITVSGLTVMFVLLRRRMKIR